MTENNNDNDTVENRSQMIVLYDAQDCNPNGDPLDENRPRIDPETEQAEVTDVRLKRYIRDQLDEDGYGIYVRSPTMVSDSEEFTRGKRFDEVMNITKDEAEEMDVDRIIEALCDSAIDIRLFGATLSFGGDGDSDLVDSNLPSIHGPVQFSIGRSLNSVQLSDETRKITTVLRSKEGNEQGSFGDDFRLRYAILRFSGVVNENAANGSGLSTEDVELLDKTVWKSIKNQTLSRSKLGQEPRFYTRVEFESEYHIGDLEDTVTLSDRSEPDAQMRNISDVVLNLDEFVKRLESNSERIETVQIKASKYTTFELDGKTVKGHELTQTLQDTLDADVNEIEIYG